MDRLGRVNTPETSTRVVRRGMRAAAAAALPLAVLAAAPAHAEAGEGWFSEVPGPVDMMHALTWFVLGPLAVMALITLLVLVPALIRREPILPRHEAEPQWIGGPGKSAQELPASASETKSGGASGSW